MDIFLVNSGPATSGSPKLVRNALYKKSQRNVYGGDGGRGRKRSGVRMGVAVGDYDNDGWPDMFVTAYGKCTLYKNNHDGTFADVTDKAGLAAPDDHERRLVRLRQ